MAAHRPARRRALCIPYEKHPLYPDIVAFRQTKEGLVADILDPHGTQLDGLDLNASAVKRKIDDEFERFSKFATDVLGIIDKQKAQKINRRKYVEYLLRNGTMEEKRSLLGSLRNKLVLSQGEVTLNDSMI